jgi:hypothetical protein
MGMVSVDFSESAGRGRRHGACLAPRSKRGQRHAATHPESPCFSLQEQLETADEQLGFSKVVGKEEKGCASNVLNRNDPKVLHLVFSFKSNWNQRLLG